MEDKKIANLVAVDMGYGHQRAAYALRSLAGGEVINANNYKGINKKEKDSWLTQNTLYEKISVFKKIPLVGPAVFYVMDFFQDIPEFYPGRDLSAKTAQAKFFLNAVKNKGLGKNLVTNLNKTNLPLISTFPVPIYFSEYYKYNQQIYCVICDADISRFWAPANPSKSNTIYFAPTHKAAKRLTMYGIKRKNIILTGFPLPPENIGGLDKPILKKDLAGRLARLDTQKTFSQKWENELATELPAALKKTNEPLTIMFAVGGAGAQSELAVKLLINLKHWLKQGKYKLILAAGVRKEVADLFTDSIKSLHVSNVEVLYAETKNEYFKKFGQELHQTDLLITKPSELSFYAGLGLPIIMTEPVGAQEIANQAWLLSIGAGIKAPNFRYSNEWLEDSLNDGSLARAAYMGYRNAENLGFYNIEKIIKNS